MALKNITKLKHRFPFREIRYIPRFFFHHWPSFVLLAITTIISYLNYEPGTYLTGWDNLHPEFNFGLNIKRSLFSVWQEYQSLGLLAGMAHASDLFRQLFLLFISTIFGLPNSFIRYSWVFLMYITGTLGSYKLISHLLEKKFDLFTNQTAAFLGGLFYALNLATVQTFFTSFETFTSFFGFLPWLTLAFIIYLHKPSKKNTLLLFFTCLISAPAFYVETIFVVFSLFLFVILLNHAITYHFRIKELTTALKAVLILILTQSYWLLPNILFVLTNSNVALTAKNNTIASPETFYRNLQFGNLNDISLLKGYWFDLLFYTPAKKFDYLFLVWRQHLSQPFIILLGTIFFCLILAGIIFALSKKLRYANVLAATFFICLFFLLGGGKFIVSLPLVGELFRSPFTKFSTILSLLFAYFFSIGIIFMMDAFSFLSRRFTHHFTIYTIAFILFAFSSPIFSGNLISSSIRINIPDDYFQLFDFFNHQDPATRIANFPQLTHWGWNNFDWQQTNGVYGGYYGSGFYWYGIEQPILDRAFDVWSKDSEYYYDEINQAIYSDNAVDFDKTIDKYSVDWILVDKNIIATDISDTGLNKILGFLSNSSKYSLVKNISDNLLVYRNNPKNPANNFISVTSKKPTTPFINHLSERPSTNWELNKDNVVLKLNPSELSLAKYLTLPSFTQTENLVLSELSYRINSDNIIFKITPQLPKVTLDDKEITLESQSTYVYQPIIQGTNSFVLNIDRYFLELEPPGEFTNFDQYYPITYLYLPTKNNFNFRVFDGNQISTENITPLIKSAEPKQCYQTKENRKIEKIVDQQTTTLIAKDATGCLSVKLPSNYPNSLMTIFLTHSSITNTPVSVFFSREGQILTVPQEIDSKKSESKTKFFGYSPTQSSEINIVIEANESQSVQELNIQDVNITYHQLLFESQIRLEKISEKTVSISENIKDVSVVFPISDTSYNISQTPSKNQLFPETTNCDALNTTYFNKEVSSDGFKYTSINANACDHVNFRYLPHNISYLLSFDYKNISGQNTIACLYNYATNRCDIFERLINTPKLQSVISNTVNPKERDGYTLNLFNQSFGKIPDINLIKSIHLNPVHNGFLKNIIVSEDTNTTETTPFVVTTHPAEFIYTTYINSTENSLLNLFQSKSKYWYAIKVPNSQLRGNLLTYIIKLPYLYLTQTKLTPVQSNSDWYNSWILPKGESSIFIVYLPQYLEFVGLFILFISTAILFNPFKYIKKRLSKKKGV